MNIPYFRLYSTEIVDRQIQSDIIETTLNIQDEILNGRSFVEGRKHETVNIMITLESSGNTTNITNDQIIEQIRKQFMPIV